MLNIDGDICDNIQGITPQFVILSVQRKVYRGDLKQIKLTYLNAIERFGRSIDILGHLCNKQIAKFLNSNDITQIVEAANANEIALELNCANLVYGKTDLNNLNTMLNHANHLYVNSDSHTMNEFVDIRKKGFQFLNGR